MVTHDVDEAVTLSDRIVMMTNGPAATIGRVLDVPFDRPRDRIELSESHAYAACRDQVLAFLAHPVAEITSKSRTREQIASTA